MASDNQLGVRRTPILDQLFVSAEEALMSDPFFKSEFLEYWRQSLVARWSIRLFADAVRAKAPIDWERLASLYHQNYDYAQNDDAKPEPRHIQIRAEGKRQIQEAARLILADEQAMEKIVLDPSAGGVKVPQVAVLLFALQYTIDVYREKARTKPS